MRSIQYGAQTVIEDIVLVEHNYNGLVKVLVGRGSSVDNIFQVFPNQNLELYNITDDPGANIGEQVIRPAKMYYTELMSPNPVWAPNKPAGVFRKDDLWHFVDLLRQA